MAGNSNRIQLADYLLKQSTFGKNYVLNPSGFQNTQNITVSGATVSRNTTTPLTSISDLQVGFTAAAQYAEWSMETLDSSMAGRNCEIRADYKLSLGSGATVVAEIYQGGVAIASSTLQNTLTSIPLSFNAPCGQSTTTFRITQTVGAVASTLNIANVTYGMATNISNQGLVTDWQEYTLTIGGTSSAPTIGTATTNIARWRRVGGDMEIYYQLVTTSAGSIGSGDYLFPLPSGYTIDTAKLVPSTSAGYSAPTVGAMSLQSVGTGTATCQMTAYDTTKLYTYCNSGAGTQSVGSANYPLSNGSGVRYSFYAKVPIVGWAGQSAVTIDQTNFGWTSYTPTLSNSTNASATTFFRRTGETMHVKGKVTWSGAGAGGVFTVSIPSGYTINTAKLPGGTGGLGFGGGSLGHGHWRDQSAGDFVVTVSYNSTTAVDFTRDASVTDQLTGTQFASPDSLDFEFFVPIVGWVENQNAPILVGSVTSGSSNALRIESGRVVGTTGALTRVSTPSWISMSRTTTGQYTGTIATGVFSSAPYCVCSSENGTVTQCKLQSDTTATQVKFFTLVNTSTGATSAVTFDEDFHFICFGPK